MGYIYNMEIRKEKEKVMEERKEEMVSEYKKLVEFGKMIEGMNNEDVGELVKEYMIDMIYNCSEGWSKEELNGVDVFLGDVKLFKENR